MKMRAGPMRIGPPLYPAVWVIRTPTGDLRGRTGQNTAGKATGFCCEPPDLFKNRKKYEYYMKKLSISIDKPVFDDIIKLIIEQNKRN